MTKYVYMFSEGNKDMRNLLGGKGANLAEMTKIGLPVPKGFTITTEACNKYYADNLTISDDIINEIFERVALLEKETGKKMGDINKPLFLSVRSGARASMPGMMDSIHFLGMNDEIAENFAQTCGNPRFVYDTYRRFIQTYSDIAEKFADFSFEKYFEDLKEELNVINDTDLTCDQLKYIISKFKEQYKKLKNQDFPTDYKYQLLEAVKGVFKSWNGKRARSYRKINSIPDNWGTAVNVQENVFGNMNDLSGTGVAFSRNPATGENKVFGEYLINAQGDDVVAGLRTPLSLDTLKDKMPSIYDEFISIAKKLETHFKDMQDMEFTIENGKLYILQTRNGKRTAHAALKIAVDLVNEGLITKKEALMRVEAAQLDQLLHPTFDLNALKEAKKITVGLAASPGAASGKIYFNARDVATAKKRGEEPLLVRLETSPEDIQGMHDASGVLTVRGGMTSHAAVVARGMGRCCVSGCGDLIINEDEKTITTKDGVVFNEGDYLSIDGSTGSVYCGQIKTVDATISGDFETFMSWADEYRVLKIRANADNLKDAAKAIELGAEGIGLCRTEHMFFDKERIINMRKMILAETSEEREKALEELIVYQKNDFKEMYKVLKNLPMTIRYLDPPLHEFSPHTDDEIECIARKMNVPIAKIKHKCEELHEFNPMMGHRGCRLLVTYPEIAKMQTRAIIEAAIEVKNEEGFDIVPEIMIPLVGENQELEFVKDIVVEVAETVKKEKNSDLVYHIGTMIEVPRAALTAGEIAKNADFFSFGTNDLTQMTFGFSRDDASKFLDAYYQNKIYDLDPFAKLDQIGVGELVKIAVERGRKENKNLKLGICGEHGGEPNSIEFFHNIGLDYVSCSPFRVPIARLAAAKAAIKNGRN